MLGGYPGLNSTHVRPYSLNIEGAVAALSYVPIISPFSLRIYGYLILTHSPIRTPCAMFMIALVM